jgi:hypothetical protein
VLTFFHFQFSFQEKYLPKFDINQDIQILSVCFWFINRKSFIYFLYIVFGTFPIVLLFVWQMSMNERLEIALALYFLPVSKIRIIKSNFTDLEYQGKANPAVYKMSKHNKKMHVYQ